MKRVAQYPWSSYPAYTRATRKNAQLRVSCERVWGEVDAAAAAEGRRRYRAYVLNWLKKEEEERSKPERQRDETVFNPFAKARLGCYLGGERFRDFIQGLLDDGAALSDEVVGADKWHKEVGMGRLLAAVAEADGMEVDDLVERRRPHPERDVAMDLCWEAGQKSLREIGELFGVSAGAVSLASKRVRSRRRQSRHFRREMETRRATRSMR